MIYLKAAGVWLIVAVVAVFAVSSSGMIEVAANREHSGPVGWILETAREASVERQAASIDVPELDSPDMQLAGINDFDAMCVGCHGGPGKERSSAGRGLNPIAPDLATVATERTAAEIYWATRNGIRMTGMPAWSASHDDQSLWPVVSFISMRLPDLDADGYAAMLAEATGHGHHSGDSGSHTEDDGEPHEHGNGADQANDPAAAAAEEHDHSTHEH